MKGICNKDGREEKCTKIPVRKIKGRDRMRDVGVHGKMEGIGCECVDWIQLAQDRV
jgi:hypothetical protein